MGIQKMQAGKVSFRSQLFGGSGQEGETGNGFGQLLNCGEFRAHLVWSPLESMRFVYDEEVPGSFQGRFSGRFKMCEQV